jgi:hypothetical protein
MTLEPTTLFVHAVATLGAVHVIGESHVARPLRIAWASAMPGPLADMIYCTRCLAFWVSVAIALVLPNVPTWFAVLSGFLGVGYARVVLGGLVEFEPGLPGDLQYVTTQEAARQEAARERSSAGTVSTEEAAGLRGD